MKIILNKCYGGFGISPMAYKLYAEKKGIELYPYIEDNSNYISKGETIYRKTDWSNERLDIGITAHYFTKDLGESIIENVPVEEMEAFLRVYQKIGGQYEGKSGKLKVNGKSVDIIIK